MSRIQLRDLSVSLQKFLLIQYPELSRQSSAAGESPGQEALAQALERVLGQRACREYRPLPDRRYRVDVAIPDALLAVEINGWANHGKSLRGFRGDHERTRALLLAGWRVVPFTHREALQDTERCVEIVLQLVNQGSGESGKSVA
ncbi:endonuclease domain-containing protein [Acidithiobacillus ferrooxidans]|uniref:endonuclease domain-containing protein n=1 Tax=Acidithiobacillus ferrooxidans TaxID=920 RepID=UPI0021478D7E|nr:endonuclease domain-containing protein [Acidithiobacillus ferrooxidans]MCR1347336.1 endonuclease domain-containing protein [Acidithiobacillus ferrooxidans]MCR1354803.1 endonuclease domain-containing protein [Acidithiobacillus ferrooxidans]